MFYPQWKGDNNLHRFFESSFWFSLISSCHCPNHKSVFLQILHDSPVSWKILLCTCLAQINLTNFDRSTWKSQNLHFNGLLLTKVYNVWAKNYRVCNILNIDAQIKGKMTCGFLNDMRNLVNFTGALKTLKIGILRDFFVQGI